jgi:hypothetical protein
MVAIPHTERRMVDSTYNTFAVEREREREKSNNIL